MVSKIVVSKHAKQRFSSRFKMLFHKSYFYNEHLTHSLIHSLVETGERIWWWEQSPFYKNKVNIKYGATVAIKCRTKEIYFLCTQLANGDLMVRTCVRDFNPRL